MRVSKLNIALAVGVCALDVNGLLRDSEHAGPLSVALVITACGALLARRRAPLVVLAVTIAAQLGVLALGDRPLGVAMAIGAFTVAERGGFSRIAIGGFLAAVLTATIPGLESETVVFAAFMTGAALHTQRDTWAHRDEYARHTAQRERTAIARELHDIVAHSVSVMLVGVRGARDVIATEPQVAYETLGRVEASAERSLAELRRSLAVLRDADQSLALAPQPSLRDLQPLLADAGLPVRLEVEGEPRALSDGLELSAYRIVQEALTNVRRHARATEAVVRLGYGADALTVEVVDDGAGDRGGEGQGLIGMRERTASLGGELEAGDAEGGYRVRAILPVA